MASLFFASSTTLKALYLLNPIDDRTHYFSKEELFHFKFHNSTSTFTFFTKSLYYSYENALFV